MLGTTKMATAILSVVPVPVTSPHKPVDNIALFVLNYGVYFQLKPS